MWILDLIAGLVGGGGAPGSLRAPRDMTRAQSLSYGVGTVGNEGTWTLTVI